MTRVRHILVPVLAVALGAVLVAAAVAQAPQGAQRGFGGPSSRGSLLGLLRMEQVQKDLKLNEETVAKVAAIQEKLATEMREKFAALREMDDREQQRAKMAELSDEFDGKAREAPREVLSREQTMRLYQIRMQVRSVTDSLNNRFVAGRLSLTDDQKAKLADIVKDAQAARTAGFSSMRDMSPEQRTEAMAKFRKIRTDADEKALGLLTAEQKESFESMKGEKIELPSRGGRQ